MLTVAIYIQDTYTSEFNRVDLFDDEKISVTSSIQNINDISKTFTDFSQTFTVPATKQNNKIFRHWYDNSNDSPFSTLVKSNAFIEIDTITFRKGKIQLESANVVDGQPQDYSITFIGILGNLKDTFGGLYLKDLTTDTTYDFFYNASVVKNKIVTTATSSDIMFPLISSIRYWVYGGSGLNDINNTNTAIRANELFPSIRLRAVLNMIENQFGINFDGTIDEPSTFLSDARFTNAYLYLKNSEVFISKKNEVKLLVVTLATGNNYSKYLGNITNSTVTIGESPASFVSGGITYSFVSRKNTLSLSFSQSDVLFSVSIYKNGILFLQTDEASTSISTSYTVIWDSRTTRLSESDVYTFYINVSEVLNFLPTWNGSAVYQNGSNIITTSDIISGSTQTTTAVKLRIISTMPEIKIEDFFTGLLKMFNLTCYSSDGVNYTIEQLESYYGAGSDIDITKYVLQDKKDLNRVKTYKKINFDYQKSESIINVGFNSENGIEYGSLHYSNTPPSDGEEYSITLPFEDLNFQNIGGGLLQVGYTLKSDSVTKYTPKPVILYDYNPTALTTSPTFYFNTNISGGTSSSHSSYKAFGQETLISGQTYGLNFPPQESTLTNSPVPNGLYNQYYEKYFSNIFNYKARLVKVSAILPTSILTSLKLNDNIIIRDEKYLINTMNTDLTTGEVQFELLTDQRL